MLTQVTPSVDGIAAKPMNPSPDEPDSNCVNSLPGTSAPATRVVPADNRSSSIPFIHYPVLDSLRGVAVLWVLWHHTFQFFDIVNETPIWLARIAELGFLGVDVFFVLSGFLISGILFPDLDTGVRLRRFYIRRFFRIIPTYFLVVVVGIVLSVTMPDNPIPFVKADHTSPFSFLFLSNYLPITPILAHTWSLAVEEHFYVCYPLMLVALIATTNRLGMRRTTTRVAVIFALFCVCVFFNFVRMKWLHDSIQTATNALPNSVWATHFRVDALAFGCLCKAMEPCATSVLRFHWLRVLFSVLCLGFSLVVFFFFCRSGFVLSYWSSWTLAYLAAGGLLVASCFGSPIVSKVILAVPGLQSVGKWSYAIYLWQAPVLYVFWWFSAIKLEYAVIFMVAVVVLGKVTTETIERGILQIRDRVSP
jgi:peptidoglycan/LPS O-acetylase OafA/YrhL